MSLEASFILGHRDHDDEDGVFVCPPGVDARTATQDEMLLYITTKIPQLAMTGVVSAPFPQIVPHLIGYAPIILPNLVSADFITHTTGYMRPFDNYDYGVAKSQVKSETTQFTFTQTGGKNIAINYFAYTIPVPS